MKTMFEKIWEDHLVGELDAGSYLIYIDRHLIHEVTSPQAFEGLKLAGRKVRRPEATFATMDHNVSTRTRDLSLADPISAIQMQTLKRTATKTESAFMIFKTRTKESFT